MTQKRLEIAAHLGRWEVVHNGVAVCDCETAAEAAKAASAIARTQPRGDSAVICLDPAAARVIAGHGRWRGRR